MRVGYLDCFSGISGDMFLGALVDAGVPLETIEGALCKLPVAGWSLSAEPVMRSGITATRVAVELDEHEHHPHRGLGDVVEIIESGGLPEPVAERACAVFRNLAEAEAKVHNTDTDHVHFHEVGAVDAICDIVGTVAGLAELGIERLLHSPVRLGGGTVEAAHGRLPVPAPATAELLRGRPTAGGPVEVELTTPTGAALLKTLAEPAPYWPEMTVELVAHGAGARDLRGLPNVLRLAVGTAPPAGDAPATESDVVWLLEVNLDDMTGEEMGHCTEQIMAAGALDAFKTPVQMKKNRPAVQLTVLCAPDALEGVERALWTHSSTLGIRRALWQRSKLARKHRTVDTPWGQVRLKVAYLGERVVRCEPEYEDCRSLAERNGLSLRQVRRAALRAWDESASGD
ncbi:MAG: nickel pincer cofactor biosynthesis protein LarC [Candidatus Brocadiia bacterium]